MDIHLAVQKVEERFDYEGNEMSTEAWNTIRDFIAEALKPSHNTGSPKLLDDMESFAIACDRAGNGRDARQVRSWVKQLRAGA